MKSAIANDATHNMAHKVLSGFLIPVTIAHTHTHTHTQREGKEEGDKQTQQVTPTG